ncbi:LCP family protein [Paenibacillus farraposensis]|uniref:LCP family protein n=1 Tax=Paenibacillus farraposensis TaxID=2807095 RepID=A0ABW4DB33_9BACL|nr:LCP family protein [Paenibacillus farraposensis]MCC3380041.1 LCP family protein [Paenibacillus farraposensis]
MSNLSNGLPPRTQSGNESAKRKKTKKKKSFFRSFMKFVLFLLIIGILAGSGYVYYIYNQVEDVLDTGNNREVPKTELAESKPLTVLLLGTDYRPDHPTYLSDVIMVATLNPSTKSSTIVSLPRDTRLEMDGYKPRKLNEYYPVFKAREKESGEVAEEQMKKMIGKYLNINIDYVTVINFQGFRDVVDSLGGVDVTVDKNMCYRDSADGTNINLTAGAKHLNGDQALDFVRYRKSNCRPKTDGSDDFDRNRRQNQVLHSLIDQMQSFNALTKFGAIIKSVDKNMTTDIESQQMKNIVQTYWNISKQNVKYNPVAGTWRSPYVYIDEQQLDAARQALQAELAKKANNNTVTSSNS